MRSALASGRVRRIARNRFAAGADSLPVSTTSPVE